LIGRKGIPLTPDYPARGGNGCSKKETRLRGKILGEEALQEALQRVKTVILRY